VAQPVDPFDRWAFWWRGDFVSRHQLESPSVALDRTIRRLPLTMMRSHPDLRAYCERLGTDPIWLLAYEAMAEGRYGVVRLAALFPNSPFDPSLTAEQTRPTVLALDGDRDSLHRNPPFDADVEGVSADLCLWFPEDPVERVWTPGHGLYGLFNIARRHLECEQLWREKGKWPVEDAPHGAAARPARPRPELAVAPLREPSAVERSPDAI
jgi:hypothetical protein